MSNRNPKMKALIVLGIALASVFAANLAAADIIVDPKGHNVEQLQQDQMECRDLANGIDFDLVEEHQGRAVLRGAAAGGGFAAIAGGNKEMRRRSAAGGALVGGLQKNKAKRVDGSVEQVKVMDAQRNCLIGRGYSPLN